MSHLLDANRLVDEFAETDPRMPLLVFSLLSLYLEHGPFEFDAAQLAERLSALNLKARVNPEELASLEPDLRRFFDAGPDGWAPKPGVLTIEGDAAATAARAGDLPGTHSALS